MSVPDWPATLPQELWIDGYEESPGNNTIKSQPDVGPAKVRRRATCAPQPVSGNLVLDDTELATFKTFYETTLLAGSLRFNWTDPTDYGTAVEMRFTDPYSVIAMGDQFKLTLKLEILP